MERITLSLVSHTNVGKTTLARTLLRRDVGEVLDRAHVTEVSSAFTLIELGSGGDEPSAELVLWDTPGFGDSARLLSRLKRKERPLVWLLQQAWDRLADRPLWSSQQAALTVQRDADIVLYLVNAAEEPEDAGYVDPELELLGWIGRPVVLLLNQTGDPSAPSAPASDWSLQRAELWRRHVARHSVVRSVMQLDAFSRCWVQEGELLERIGELLDDSRKPLLRRLLGAWEERNLEVFERSVEAIAGYLIGAARDQMALPSRRPGRADKKRAMEVLADRLDSATAELMRALLRRHGLDGSDAAEVGRPVDAFALEGLEKLAPERGALLGGLVSGAVGGLAADVLAGGLTFGGGLVAGAILGALGGAGLARGFHLLQGDRLPAVGWTPAFLDRLAEQALLRYLAVAHFGRGRGEFESSAAVEPWHETVAAELRRDADAWRAAWRRLATGEGGEEGVESLVDRAARGVLRSAYPESADLLDGRGRR